LKKTIVVLAVTGYSYEKAGATKQGGDFFFVELGGKQNTTGANYSLGYPVQKGSFRGELPKTVTAVPGVYEATFVSKVETVGMYGRQQQVTILEVESLDKCLKAVEFEG